MPAPNALDPLPRELLASGQACEAGGRLRRYKKRKFRDVKLRMMDSKKVFYEPQNARPSEQNRLFAKPSRKEKEK